MSGITFFKIVDWYRNKVNLIFWLDEKIVDSRKGFRCQFVIGIHETYKTTRGMPDSSISCWWCTAVFFVDYFNIVWKFLLIFITDCTGSICRTIVYENYFYGFFKADILSQDALDGFSKIWFNIINSCYNRKFKTVVRNCLIHSNTPLLILYLSYHKNSLTESIDWSVYEKRSVCYTETKMIWLRVLGWKHILTIIKNQI